MREVETIGIPRWHFCPDCRGRHGKSVVRRWIKNWVCLVIFHHSFLGFPPAEASTPRYGEFRTQSSDVLERWLGRLRRGAAIVSTKGESSEKKERGGPLASLNLADVVRMWQSGWQGSKGVDAH